MAETQARGDIAINQNGLDFLRGIAAFYVVLNHSRGNLWVGGKALLASEPTILNYIVTALLQFTSLGTEFVILFFVLSGFSMRHSVRHSTSTSRFYLKRVLRIWPPYIVAVLFALGCEALTTGTAVRDNLVPILFYVDAWSTPFTPQFWSLPYEIVFYILCPLVLANARRVKAVGIVAVIASAVTLVWKGPVINPYQIFAADFIGNELLFFACGALCYDNMARIPRIGGMKLLALTLVLIVLAWLGKMFVGDSNMLSNIIMIILTVLLIKNLPSWIYDCKWTNWGFFSYSIYIFHFAVIALIAAILQIYGIEALEIENPFAWMAAVPVVIGVCFAMYFVAEKWSNRWVAMLRASPAQAGTKAFSPNPPHQDR